MTDSYDLNCAVLSKYDDEIIHIKFKNGSEVKLEDAIELREKSIKMFEGKRFLALVDASNILGSMTNEARNFFAKDEKLASHRMAQAIVVNNLALSLLANFYLRVNRPIREARIFKEKSNAVKWLETKKHLLLSN